MALLALLQWQQLLQWNRTPLDWALGGGLVLAALISSLAASERLKRGSPADATAQTRPTGAPACCSAWSC